MRTEAERQKLCRHWNVPKELSKCARCTNTFWRCPMCNDTRCPECEQLVKSGTSSEARRFQADFRPFRAVARQLKDKPALGENRAPWAVRSKIGEDVATCECEDVANFIAELLNRP